MNTYVEAGSSNLPGHMVMDLALEESHSIALNHLVQVGHNSQGLGMEGRIALQVLLMGKLGEVGLLLRMSMEETVNKFLKKWLKRI